MVTQGKIFRERIALATATEIRLLTDADVKRCRDRDTTDPRLISLEASIQIRAFSTNIAAARGMTAFGIYLDEFGHHKINQDGSTGEQLYQAVLPSLAQMKKRAFTYIPTSPASTHSFAHGVYESALELGPDGKARNYDTLILQLPSWEPYRDHNDPTITEGRILNAPPYELDDKQLRIRRNDPRFFRVEVEAQWSGIEGAYLDPELIDLMFAPVCRTHSAPTVDGTCPVCGERGNVAATEPVGLTVYRAHADPGVTRSNFGFGIAHVEWREDETEGLVPHIFIDLLRVWRAKEFANREIPYEAVTRDIINDMSRFSMVETLTLDQYGAFAAVPTLRTLLKQKHHRTHVRKRDHTQVERIEAWETLAVALNQRRVHMAPDVGPGGPRALAAAELKALEEVNGRIGKPKTGPITTDDLAVVISVLVYDLLKTALSPRRANAAPPLYAGRSSVFQSFGRTPPRLQLRVNRDQRLLDRRLGRGVPPDLPLPQRRWHGHW
jgi:hypothetical protein